MNERRTFWWKVGYIIAIAVLVIPLHKLSLPATKDSDGGWLAQMRKANGLAEANLGEIDASAETVKLATLGLRGIAVDILWEKANYYKKIEDWTSFGAVLTQIAYLQPHFFTVWDYQAHNLTYNTSVEFDDYNDRYHWVIEGIKFLKEGKAFNTNPLDQRFTEPRLTRSIGWFISQKIGKADEHRQYRRLFKEDDQFHASDDPKRTREQRDNWLVGAWWFKRAESEVIPGMGNLHTTPLIFYSQAPMSLIYYADAIESDSTAGEKPHFGEVARQAWSNAARDLADYGGKDLPCPYGGLIHLDALERLVAKEADLENTLEKLMPGELKKLKEAQRSKWSAEQIEALETPVEKRSAAQETFAFEFWRMVAEQTGPEHRAEALKKAGELEQTELSARDIRSSRDIVNYIFWKTRCDAEQYNTGTAENPEYATLRAREYTYLADQEKDEARPKAAKRLYEKSFDEWRKVLDHYQVIREDTIMAQELVEVIDRYRETLRQLAGEDSKFPQKFVLQDVLDLIERTNGASSPKPPPEATKPPEEKAPTRQAPPPKTENKKSDEGQTKKADESPAKTSTGK
jgi:hypothetical protein